MIGRCAPAPRRSCDVRDRGSTFVEVLVSLVLLGTAVGGTLTALRTTIVSSKRGDDQTEIRTWLLAAEDALYRTPYYSCADPGMDEGDILFEYEQAIAAAPRPDGWGAATIEIPSLQFWRKTNGIGVWDPVCSTDPSLGRSAELIVIYVLSPDSTVGKTIQVIKRGD